ncbi:hypothetical protein AVEN_123960-1 [Araneus ventricosus]|uniref:Uncharacterized protein n=1 Tax=Araneus ventricosus TaxID=182803 RepID=A0A4Y2SDM0_ARAVE|nr:hypothetical protein AVEN_27309-1 [Araneus ventricosus]GBN85336.1 hypothetical protein AVEN_123960-1 [Araneus ventricosus]
MQSFCVRTIVGPPIYARACVSSIYNSVADVSHLTSAELEPSWLGLDFFFGRWMQLGPVFPSATQQSRCICSNFASRRKCACAHQEFLCLRGNF